MTSPQRRWVKRRQAVEPVIGHAKLDHRMDRCWLAGATGDALHAVLCAAGYNIRWLLRAITRKGLQALLAALIGLWRMLAHSGRIDPSQGAGLAGHEGTPITHSTRPWSDAAVVRA
jgi:IS5 family transposase